ncbi:MAG: hypothetical protein IH840_05255 [Candidatus Heimdallarchaeota archaeon]|nr:hypothetical protein [Candidatus Heimdallarchaeota archaeon]
MEVKKTLDKIQGEIQILVQNDIFQLVRALETTSTSKIHSITQDFSQLLKNHNTISDLSKRIDTQILKVDEYSTSGFHTPSQFYYFSKKGFSTLTQLQDKSKPLKDRIDKMIAELKRYKNDRRLVLEHPKQVSFLLEEASEIVSTDLYQVLTLAHDEDNILRTEFYQLEFLADQVAKSLADKTLSDVARIEILNLRLGEMALLIHEMDELSVHLKDSVILDDFEKHKGIYRELEAEFDSINQKNMFQSEWNQLEMRDLQHKLLKDDVMHSIRYTKGDMKHSFDKMKEAFDEKYQNMTKIGMFIDYISGTASNSKISVAKMARDMKIKGKASEEILLYISTNFVDLGDFLPSENKFIRS